MSPRRFRLIWLDAPRSRKGLTWTLMNATYRLRAARLRLTGGSSHTMVARRDDNPYCPEIRIDLVNRVRREIQQGTYDTPEKLDLAVQRLLNELDSDHEAIEDRE